MNSTVRLAIVVGLLGVLGLVSRAQSKPDAASTPVVITRLYTGADGLTHAEDMPARFDKGILKLPGKLDDTAGTEFRRMQPGGAANWHNGPRYQYVITLSGHGEVEVAGGKKVPLGPGSIDLIEDLKGKGHITRNFDERLTVWIPLADAPGQ